jgi:SAM-dependent methyltransferase
VTSSPNAVEPGFASAPRRLLLGCGHDVRRDWLNLDLAALPGVDVVHDLDVVPWPFEDGAFDEVECLDILEHLRELPDAMRELHRITAPEGRVHIQGPHFTSSTWPTDPTHRRAFAINTFEFFARGSMHERDYYFDFAFARIESRRIGFQRVAHLPWNYLAEWVVNRHRRLQSFYEATFLARLFPAHHVDVVLVR